MKCVLSSIEINWGLLILILNLRSSNGVKRPSTRHESQAISYTDTIDFQSIDNRHHVSTVNDDCTTIRDTPLTT